MVNDTVDSFMFDDAKVLFKNNFVRNKNTNCKLLLILCYIRIYASRSGTVFTSINHMVIKSGYKSNNRHDEINDKFRCELKYLIDNNFIFIDKDIEKIKPNEMFCVLINRDNNIFDVSNSFVLIDESEYNCLLHSTTATDKGTLLKTFLIMKSSIKNSDGCEDNGVGYWSIKSIKNAVGNIKSDTTINTAIDDLKSIGLIFEYITGSYYNENTGETLNASNVYALSQELLNNCDCDSLMKNVINQQKNIVIEKFNDITKPNTKNKDNKVDKLTEQKEKCIIPCCNSSEDDFEILEGEEYNKAAKELGLDGCFEEEIIKDIPESLKITAELINNKSQSEYDDLDLIDLNDFVDQDIQNKKEAKKQRNIQLYGFDIDNKSELDKFNRKVVNGNSHYAIDDDDLY